MDTLARVRARWCIRQKCAMSKYSKLLRDPRWQKKRLEIMQRDNWACRFCLDPDSPLSVHHDYYERHLKPWEYPEDSLHTLCEACHELTHFSGNDLAFLKETLVSRYCFGTLTLFGTQNLFDRYSLAAL